LKKIEQEIVQPAEQESVKKGRRTNKAKQSDNKVNQSTRDQVSEKKVDRRRKRGKPRLNEGPGDEEEVRMPMFVCQKVIRGE